MRKLQANVMSPRIFLYDLRKAFGQLLRLLLVVAALGAAGWGAWLGLREGLFENPEFRLAKIELNANSAVDGPRLLEVAGIDPEGSLFDCDAAEIEARLEALPELTGARVTREFPGTLKVEVNARRPVVWVACESGGVPPRDPERGLLVDAAGLMFRCTPDLYPSAAELPVIEVRPGEAELEPGTILRHDDFTRGTRLLAIARKRVPGADRWVDTVRQAKAWCSEMLTRDEITAVFGHEDLERQMGDLLSAVEHARDRGQRIARIVLIPKRNLPVEFHEAGPPRAIPVDELEDPAGPGEAEPRPAAPEREIPAEESRIENSDLRKLLEH